MLNRLLPLLFALFTVCAFSQNPGAVDLSFNPLDIGSFNSYMGPNFGSDGIDGPGENSREVNCLALQPNGKVLVGGSFHKYNNTDARCITRLNSDGSIDTTFNNTILFNEPVYAIALQPDGKILVAGDFIHLTYKYIVRLNEDGSLDTTFDPSQAGMGSYLSSGAAVRTIAVMPDGKIFLGGAFTVEGTAYRNIIRLNADGTRDDTFTPGTGPDSTVLAIQPLPDSKILLGGLFGNYNGNAKRGIIRISANGTYDATFNAQGNGLSNASISTFVRCITLLPDGKIVIAGNFAYYNSINRETIARLNANGSLDETFTSGPGPAGGIYAVLRRPDGKLMVAGSFLSYHDVPYKQIILLNENGWPDYTSFNVFPLVPGASGKGAQDDIYAMAMEPDGDIIIGGKFSAYNNTLRKRIARIKPNGELI